jgi:hypothetical protein
MTKNDSSNTFALNAVIGFLSLLLCLLVFGLFSRLIYPRIQNQRAEKKQELISNVIQLEVLNGCGVAGLADQFTSTLRKSGFDVVESGNFDNFNMEQTTVIARTISRDNAKRVARALGIDEANILVEASDDFYLDATVVIGSDYRSLKLN